MSKNIHLTALVLAAFFTGLVQAEVKPIRFRNGALSLSRLTPEQVQTQFSALAARGPSSHVIIQFESPVTPELKEGLRAAGVELLDYLGDNGFFAGVSQARFNAAALAAVPALTRVADIQQGHKLHPDLLFNKIHDWMVVGAKVAAVAQDGGAMGDSGGQPAVDQVVGVYVKFHKDVPLDPDATRIVHQFGAAIRSYLAPINSLVIELPYGKIKPLADHDSVAWIEPPLPRFSEVNAENRVRTGADIVQAAPYGLTGAGVGVMVYDGGRVRTTHQDFQGRAAVGAGELACTAVSDHSTHVAGTIGGAGVADPTEKGMAPGVDIISYGYNQGGGCSLSAGFLYTDPGDLVADYTEAINTYGADISNNSIGTNTAPNGFDCNWEGDYGLCSSLIDAIVRGSVSPGGAPFRICWANGNERQVTRCGTTYHTTAPPACAKNHIAVGALNSNNDSVTSFTSWGPSDDGRMKPDISAPGCEAGGDGGVRSCSSSSDTAYSVKCGTSMASPTVCGISALLLQDYRVQFPTRPDFRNSTLKILLAHTAVDLVNAGPDNQTGYGSVRIQPCVDFMRTGNFLENTVDQGGSYNVLVLVNPGETQMKVTLAWDDPESGAVTVGTLVNDLDLVVFDPNNVQRFPWTLDINNPGNPAVQTQKNSLDNIEQVLVINPTPGVYRVEVRGFNVPQGPQPFSLCASPLLVNCSRQGSAGLDKSKYPCSSTATLTVVDCDLNTDDQVVETVNVTIDSTSEPAGETVTLTETGPQTALFRGTIPFSTTNAPSVLLVADGDTVTLTYIDADDGQGGINVTVTTTATVDCTAPMISNVATSNIGARNATVTFDTNESAKGTVRWGTSCGALPNSVVESGFNTSHSLVIGGLSPNTTYYFAVDAVDSAGNSASDDNGGACYTFATPDIPELFTEEFAAADNDLDNKTVMFTPDPGISRYKACTSSITALPTDPTGGTVIPSGGWPTCAGTQGDDCNIQVSVTGGETVKLHGVSYGSFFIGTNGYVTFTAGDTEWTESLANHFDLPRISGMFNDLTVPPGPGGAGTISHKQVGDRVAVTWLGVAHYNTTTQVNTFQIEMYFDGRIALSYLVMNDTDGLSGLSPGGGVTPDFFESDLSNQLGGCGPQPPVAGNGSATVSVNTSKDITLAGSDPNGDPIVYIITSLPANGSLYDPVAALTIASTPYTLAGGGNVVRYSTQGYVGGDSFQFKVNDGGGDSNTATVTITVVAPTATNGSATLNVNTSKNVSLVGSDPNNNPLAYIITSLPAQGSLYDPVAAVTIAATPYTLAGGGNVVRYSTQGYVGGDSFQFKVNLGGAGGDSNTATVTLSIVPPTASNGSATTAQNTAKNITLVGADLDGDPLTYVITALPTSGTLRDPVVIGTIVSVPYTLAGGGNVVRYTPSPGYVGADSFQFKVNLGGAGGDSNTATVSLSVIIPATGYSFPLNVNPGWTVQGAWAFGAAGGQCGDPFSANTGANVYGYNLSGCYAPNLTPQYLTTTALDCSGLTNVTLRFWRWLRVEASPNDNASVEVSNNGTTWTTIWSNPGSDLFDFAWAQQTYDISAVADNESTVFIRWGMGPTDLPFVEYGGWNIDDIEVTGTVPSCGAVLHGDMDVNTVVNSKDIEKFILVLTDPGSATQQETCAADCLTDSTIDMLDVEEFVLLLLDNPVP